MGESDGEVSSIPKADYDIIESQIESPHLVSNPIIDSPPVKKDSFATVVNQQFCRIISEKENQPIEEVNSFVRLLNSDSDNVKFEAASSLLHVIKMNHTSVIVECGGISHLIKALKTGNSKVRDECAKCIGALISSSAKIRNYVIQANGLDALLDILGDSPSCEASRTCMDALSHLFYDKPRIRFATIAPTIPRLVKLLDIDDDPDMLSRVSQILSDLCYGDACCIQAVIDAGAKPRLTNLLTHQIEAIVTSALRALRSLVLRRDTSPISHYTHSARVSSSKRKLDYLKVLSPIKLITPSTQYPRNLSEFEVMICENVEFFQVTGAEETDHEMEFESVGSTRAEHAGLRCIHCGQTPFVVAYFSTVFPRRISSIAASLYHMADMHFTKCNRIPSEIGNKFRYFARLVDQERSCKYKEKAMCKNVVLSKSALDLFCVDLCERIGIQNDSISKSGLVFTKTTHDEQSSLHKKFDDMADNTMVNVTGSLRHDIISKPDLAYTRTIHDEQNSLHKRFDLMPDKTMINSSSALSEKAYQHFRRNPSLSYDCSGYYQGEQHHQGEWTTSPYPYQQLSVAPEVSDIADSNGFQVTDFVQDMHGLWQCRYCISSPAEEKLPGSTWHKTSAPPAAFKEQHTKLCPFAVVHQTVSQRLDGSSHCEEFLPTHNSNYHPLSFYHNSQQLPEIKSYPNDPELSRCRQKVSHFSDFKPGYQHIACHPPPISQPHGAPMWSESPSKSRDNMYNITPESKESQNVAQDKSDLTCPEDRELITNFLYTVIGQLRRCSFAESDTKTARGGVRTNTDIGFGGMQCIHCMDKNYPRKFFWSNVDRLANSFSEISNHVIRCKHVPPELGTHLTHLKSLHQDQMSQLPRGSQKVFFRRMWRRIHGEEHEPFIPVLGRSNPKSEKLCSSPSLHESKAEIVESTVERRNENDIEIEMAPREAAKALAEMIGNPLSCSKRVLLGTNEDKDWLSENDCYLRRNIEVFCATSNSTRAKGRHSKVSIGRIGFRCVHCTKSMHDVPLSQSAYFFPKTVDKIYHCVREFHQEHLRHCPFISEEGKVRFKSFSLSTNMCVVLRQYYVDSAKKLGMHDTPSGIRVHNENIATPGARAMSSVMCSEGGRLSASTGSHINQATAVTPSDSDKGVAIEAMETAWL